MAERPERHVIVEVLPDHANGIEVPPNGTLPEPEPARPQAMSPQELRRGEGDVIDDLFRSDEASRQEIAVLVLTRIKVRQFDADGNPKRDADGALLMGPLELRLRGLRQSQIDSERRKCGRIWQINEEGVRENAFDPTELNARVVVQSMVPEDRQRYLEDRRMWDHFGAGGPVDVLDKWLNAGELAKAGALVMKLSGIRTDPQIERLLVEQSSGVEAG